MCLQTRLPHSTFQTPTMNVLTWDPESHRYMRTFAQKKTFAVLQICVISSEVGRLTETEYFLREHHLYLIVWKSRLAKFVKLLCLLAPLKDILPFSICVDHGNWFKNSKRNPNHVITPSYESKQDKGGTKYPIDQTWGLNYGQIFF